MRGRPRTVSPRNPFTIMLLRLFFESEAIMTFGSGKAAQEAYLAIPRGEQRIVADVTSFKHKDVNEYMAGIIWARNTIERVIDHVSDFSFSDEMLNRIVKRLTFYCRFDDFNEFDAAYKRHCPILPIIERDKKDEYTTQLDFESRKNITKAVELFFRSEDIFLQQNGTLWLGIPWPNICRLESDHIILIYTNYFGDYIIKPINESEDVPYRFITLSSFFSNKAAIRKNVFGCYCIINEHLEIVGEIDLRVIGYADLVNKTGSITTLLYDGGAFNVYGNGVLIKCINAVNLKIAYTLLINIFNIVNSSVVEIVLIPAEKNQFHLGFNAGFKVANSKILSKIKTPEKKVARIYPFVLGENEKIYYTTFNDLVLFYGVDSLGLHLY